jgi:hypothetical protein
MSTDNLEQFIRKNRAAFDTEEPAPDLWKGIEENLAKPQRRILPWRQFLWRAAAVVLIAGTAWAVNDLTDQHKPPVALTEQGNIPENPEVQELLEAEVYYASQVESQIAEVEASLRENPEILQELKQEFSELDSSYASLRRDLNENIAPEQIIEAMMQTHRTKANILNEILRQLNQEKKHHETTYDF